MKKKIILKEHQLKKILEARINDFNIEDIGKALESIECTGESLKTLVFKVLKSYGYEDIQVLFIGHDKETHELRYIVHTEGPVITYKTKSEISPDDRPCLNIYDVKVYQLV